MIPNTMKCLLLIAVAVIGCENKKEPPCARQSYTTTLIPMMVGKTILLMPITTCHCDEYADGGRMEPKTMSWSLTILADRPIEERDLVKVLSEIAEKDVSAFPSRQAWGWSSLNNGLGVDVDLPDGKKLTLRGAYYSADLAKVAAMAVAGGLRELGYTVRIGSLSQ